MNLFEPLLWTQTTGKGSEATHVVLVGSAPQNVLIYADTLCFQPGATYEFPGQPAALAGPPDRAHSGAERITAEREEMTRRA